MLSGGALEELNAQVARDAAQADLRPMTLTDAELTMRPFPIPVIGYMDVGEKFSELKDFFVDASGFGEEGEPALTHNQFEEKARVLLDETPESVYWAVTEVGQFQVHVTAFLKRKLED